jgi:hypothetical protein
VRFPTFRQFLGFAQGGVCQILALGFGEGEREAVHGSLRRHIGQNGCKLAISPKIRFRKSLIFKVEFLKVEQFFAVP